MSETYQALAAPFEETFTRKQAGVDLTYITGEQAVSRLNETLGAGSWSFRVVEHGHEPEADEFWVLGELTATIDGAFAVRQQFGSQQRKRRRTGEPLDTGFDLKGAATDALKKCASLIGVALYLSHKESVQAYRQDAPPEPRQIRAVRSAGQGAASTTGGRLPPAGWSAPPPDLGPAIMPRDDAPAAGYWRERYRALLDRASACDLDLRPYELPEGVTQGTLNALGKKLRLVVEEAEASQVITFPEEGGNGARRGN